MATTSLNPGVGPTNADIATAVAAPSAATIAAAVAAPSAATIATAVAAAVPTLTQINSSVASNAPSPNNWVYLGAGNMQSVSNATVSFSAYKKLRVAIRFQIGGTAQNPYLTLNNDTTSDMYSGANLVWSAGSSAIPQLNDYALSSRVYLTSNNNVAAGYTVTGYIDIDNANLTNWKIMNGQIYYVDGTGSTKYCEFNGKYLGTSAITSVKITDQGNNNFNAWAGNTNGFHVYGMN